MAQILKPNRLDNRGGHKPKTSTKKMFTYRVEESQHELLKEIAKKLNDL
jgi:predicted HicB family RNase H-like nuclease